MPEAKTVLGAMVEKLMTEGVNMFKEEGPNGDKISVIAEIKSKAGHEEEVRVILHGLVAPSRQEDGCEVYHLLEDKKTPGGFSTYEEWTSSAALEKHLDGEDTKAALERAKPMLSEPLRLTVLRKLS